MRPRHGSCDARSSERSEVIREKGSGYEKYGMCKKKGAIVKLNEN